MSLDKPTLDKLGITTKNWTDNPLPDYLKKSFVPVKKKDPRGRNRNRRLATSLDKPSMEKLSIIKIFQELNLIEYMVSAEEYGCDSSTNTINDFEYYLYLIMEKGINPVQLKLYKKFIESTKQYKSNVIHCKRIWEERKNKRLDIWFLECIQGSIKQMSPYEIQLEIEKTCPDGIPNTTDNPVPYKEFEKWFIKMYRRFGSFWYKQSRERLYKRSVKYFGKFDRRQRGYVQK
eukprot:UN29815